MLYNEEKLILQQDVCGLINGCFMMRISSVSNRWGDLFQRETWTKL